ncbi:peptidase inhibitor family I36 protein [Nonomuraea sp. NPDC004297]
MKRKIALSVAALLVSATGLIGSAPAAQAGSSAGATSVSAAVPCAGFCLFQHDEHNFYGGLVRMYYINGTCQNISDAMNNSASSMVNTTDRTVRLYNLSACAGSVGYIAQPNSEDEDFSNNGFDNKASSLR